MTCPRCYFELENELAVCPECGVRLARSISGVMKTSSVMIAADGEAEFFSSVQDVPEPLRTQLIEITNGRNSGTIVIADQAGKDQLTQVMARREQAREEREARAELAAKGTSRAHWIAWAGAGVVLVAGAAIAAIFLTH